MLLIGFFVREVSSEIMINCLDSLSYSHSMVFQKLLLFHHCNSTTLVFVCFLTSPSFISVLITLHLHYKYSNQAYLPHPFGGNLHRRMKHSTPQPRYSSSQSNVHQMKMVIAVLDLPHNYSNSD